MKNLRIALMILLALCTGCQLANLKAEDEILIDSCQLKSGWAFSNGGEFPGAVGKLTEKDQALELHYDFTKGGNYVAAIRKSIFPPEITSFKVNLQAVSVPAKVTFRIQDSNGRVFQTKQRVLPANQETTIDVSSSGPWHTTFGGKENEKELKEPIKSFWILAGKDETNPQGKILIKSISVISNASPEQLKANLSGQPFSLITKNWSLTGKWQGAWNRPVLVINAEPKAKVPGLLAITCPANGRDITTRFKLDPKEKSEFTYTPPVVNGGNPYNRYLLQAKLTSGKNYSVEVLSLEGKYADKINFGSPITTSQVKQSTIGTCTHFSFGLSGAFRGWRNYQTLIDLISAAGIKWIREGVRYEKNDDGSLKIRPYDLEWIKYAKSKNLNIILVIATYAKESPEEYAEKCRLVVQTTKGLCNVFELGNEPNNFGGWRKTFGGPWNGKEKDNSTSPWVKAHLKVTNAGADAIKEISPDATVIGLGACTPTNFRYLDLGLSKNVDGVVDHPYTYSMPAERVPFCLALEKRDGVKVGDKAGSFQGMIKSYVEKFKATGQMREIWVTEFGFPSFWFNGKSEKGLYAGFTEEAQAAYLIRRFIQSFTLPVKVSCQYDFLDDYGSSSHEAEANFGLIYGDYTPKPAYFAVQRLCSLFNNFTYDPEIQVTIDKAPLHRSAVKNILVNDWDGEKMKASNEVLAYGFSNPEQPDRKQVAVWSAQPLDGQFNNRSVELTISGVGGFSQPPVTIDMLTGDSFDIPYEYKDNKLIIKSLSLEKHPLLIKLIK